MAAALVTATRVTPACAADGLIAVKSPHSAKETMTRLEDTVKARCLNVFTRVEHAAGAAKTGKTLRPTEVIIFGNPQGGTPLMECAQSMGIDLPLKALVWEDAAAQVWVAYNNPAYLAKRHAAGDCAAVKTVGNALAGVMSAVVAKSATRELTGPLVAVSALAKSAVKVGNGPYSFKLWSPLQLG